MRNEGLEISRRSVLAGLGTVGAVSAGAGVGTSAFFSDTERFADNRLTAGELDLRAGFQSHYSTWSAAEQGTDAAGFLGATRVASSPSEDITVGTAGCGGLASDLDRVVVELSDVKPGDFGLVAFELALCGDPANPGYVWANARQNLSSPAGPNAENGVGEAEAADPDETEPFGATGTSFSGELGAELRVRPFYVAGGGSFDAAFAGLFAGYPDSEAFAMDFFGAFDLAGAPTLNEFTLSVAAGLGIPLTGTPGPNGFGTGAAVGGSAFVPLDEFDPATLDPTSADRACFDAGASGVFGLAWGLDVDHANEIQTDSAAFDLGFYTEQCRHNDGAGSP
jgi:predicted ribosomally synthesized peptide with SipW-like signal peptide